MQGVLGFAKSDDFSEDRVRIGMSGGINSAALLCFLATAHPIAKRPAWLGLYYCHLREHSPDTPRFVVDCMRYARRRFPAVELGMHRCSVVDFFEAENFIPHPLFSPCTEHLKIEPMERWDETHRVTIDLVGFVRHEMSRRGEKAIKRGATAANFPIAHLSEDDCFEIVDREIGWHPAIYDIRDEKTGRRLFTHNNCLPCKNMSEKQLAAVARYFPRHYQRAMAMAARIGSYWDRRNGPGNACDLCNFG